MAEQRFRKPQVVGSSPTLGSSFVWKPAIALSFTRPALDQELRLVRGV